jgi:hypothetical protein
MRLNEVCGGALQIAVRAGKPNAAMISRKRGFSVLPMENWTQLLEALPPSAEALPAHEDTQPAHEDTQPPQVDTQPPDVDALPLHADTPVMEEITMESSRMSPAEGQAGVAPETQPVH